MNWDLAKVKQYIENGIEEDLHLDYKQIQSLQKSNECTSEMAKDVSAFANSDGGTIIYGVREEDHKPMAIDCNVMANGITKEWIENILDSRISPKIDGIKIYPIDNPDSGSQIFVISVPKSNRAPHMAKDNRYYKRYNFKSQPMEHYEVDDVRRRLDSPDIELNPIWNPRPIPDPSIHLCGEMNFTIRNNGNITVEYYTVAIMAPSWMTLSVNGFGPLDNQVIDVGGISGEYKVFSKNYGIPGIMPIWRGKSYRLLNSPIQIATQLLGIPHIIAQVSTPGASDKLLVFNINVPAQQSDSSVELTPAADLRR